MLPVGDVEARGSELKGSRLALIEYLKTAVFSDIHVSCITCTIWPIIIIDRRNSAVWLIKWYAYTPCRPAALQTCNSIITVF